MPWCRPGPGKARSRSMVPPRGCQPTRKSRRQASVTRPQASRHYKSPPRPTTTSRRLERFIHLKTVRGSASCSDASTEDEIRVAQTQPTHRTAAPSSAALLLSTSPRPRPRRHPPQVRHFKWSPALTARPRGSLHST